METFTSNHIQCRRAAGTSGLPKHLSQKIRIAIIDSGAKKTDSRIAGALRAGRIVTGRNFLPDEAADDWDDFYGHGTHITGLLLNMAPEAELFIAKVTDGQRIDRERVNCIGQVSDLRLDGALS